MVLSQLASRYSISHIHIISPRVLTVGGKPDSEFRESGVGNLSYPSSGGLSRGPVGPRAGREVGEEEGLGGPVEERRLHEGAPHVVDLQNLAEHGFDEKGVTGFLNSKIKRKIGAKHVTPPQGGQVQKPSRPKEPSDTSVCVCFFAPLIAAVAHTGVSL